MIKPIRGEENSILKLEPGVVDITHNTSYELSVPHRVDAGKLCGYIVRDLLRNFNIIHVADMTDFHGVLNPIVFVG